MIGRCFLSEGGDLYSAKEVVNLAMYGVEATM